MDDTGFQWSALMAGWDRFPAEAVFRPGAAAVVRPGAPGNDAPEPYKVISTARMSSLVGLTR